MEALDTLDFEVIQQFENRLEEIRKQEMDRYLKQLNSRERDLVELLSKRIFQKVTKVPVLPISNAYKRGEGNYFLTSLKALFDLDKLIEFKQANKSSKQELSYH